MVMETEKYQKLIGALHLIKDQCEESDICEDCPMRDVDNGCTIGRSIPRNWLIAEEPEIRVNVFRF